MTKDEIMALLAEHEAITFDGLDDGIIGVGQQWGSKTVAIYDRDLTVRALMKQGFSHLDAEEWMGHNVECAYVGESTPIVGSFLDHVQLAHILAERGDFPPEDADDGG